AHGVLGLQLLPQPGGTAPGERVLLGDGAAQPDHVLGRVIPLDLSPARVGLPLLAQVRRLLADRVHGYAFRSLATARVRDAVCPGRGLWSVKIFNFFRMDSCYTFFR